MLNGTKRDRERRNVRIRERIKRELAGIIAQGNSVPNLPEFTSITFVKIGSDLSVCRIFVSALEPKDTQRAAAKLQQYATKIRYRLAEGINLRKAPWLIFLPDDTLTQASEMEHNLAKLLNNF